MSGERKRYLGEKRLAIASCAFEDLLAVGKSNIYTFADGVGAFAFQGENVDQESLRAHVGHGRHRSPRSEYMPPLCTVHHQSVAASYAETSG